VNGVSGGSITSGANTVPTNIARSSNFIGKSNWSGDAITQGEIGIVLLYARPLSNNQISALNTEVNRTIDAATLTVDSSSSTTFGGVINNATAAISLVKQGTGTLTLSGANTYIGATTVNAGTLAITNASGLGARIFEKNIPIDDETYLAATEFSLSPLTAALNGGEDYELLFTVSQEDFPKVEKIADVTAIGYMTNVSNERVMVMKSDSIVNLTAPGFGNS
jgi:autotransporter-associated beta strand protein